MNELERTPRVLRILIVEDTAERQELLQSLYREHAWVLVHTAARAVRLVQAYDFDLVSLDFNLAGPDDGDAVASALRESRNAGPGAFHEPARGRAAAGVVAACGEYSSLPPHAQQCDHEGDPCRVARRGLCRLACPPAHARATRW
jgi:CheY-like chemotaxis protein